VVVLEIRPVTEGRRQT